MIESVNINDIAVSEIPISPRTIRPGSFVRKHFKSHKLKITIIIILGVFNSCANLLLSVLIGNFFWLEFGTDGSKGKLLSRLNIKASTLSSFFTLFVVLLLMKFVSDYYERYLAKRQAELLVKTIRENLFEAQIHSSIECFSKRSFGKYLLRYSNDLGMIQNYFMKGVIGGIKECLFLLIGVSILIRINWMLTVCIVAVFSIGGILILFLYRRQTKTIIESRTNRSLLLSFVTNRFKKFSTIKRNNSEVNSIKRFNKRSEQLFRSNTEQANRESFVYSVIYLVRYGVIGLMLWLMMTKNIFITASDGVVAILIMMLLQSSISRLLKVPGYINKGCISLRKINFLIVKVPAR